MGLKPIMAQASLVNGISNLSKYLIRLRRSFWRVFPQLDRGYKGAIPIKRSHRLGNLFPSFIPLIYPISQGKNWYWQLAFRMA